MQFNRVSLLVKSSINVSSRVCCYEHEVPILQARFGTMNVEETDDPAGMAGPVHGDFDLQEEWTRLMENAVEVQTSENARMPAPLVAFPRGVLDLEDFYERLSRKKDRVITPAPAPKQEEEPVRRAGIPSAKEQRAAAKARLDKLGIEYKGNASTDDLIALLNEVDVPPVEEDDNATVQNEERAAV